MDELPAATLWLHAACFGLVTFVVSGLIQAGLPRMLPALFAEEHWKSWKEIVLLLLVLLCISAGNYGLMFWLYPQTNMYRGFGQVLLMTVQVGIFPVVAVVFFKQMLLYRRYAAAALAVNQTLEAPTAAPDIVPANVPVAAIELVGDGQKDRLTLPLAGLLWIASADNYVRVHFRLGGQVRSQLLRASLKSIEQQVAPYPQLFRCHRMYLVNLELVSAVSGNAQGLRLHIEGAEESVPVSRSLTQPIRERLAHLSHSPQQA
ncbi:LytTR family DNA-binding domain-containing protein [Cnuella takakiae]|nr:LytTR family DNA-binding domain-containing protein [Cnuella takakiae]OLY94032.1 hypothetical protein BUE76_20675 [Cnuella takakiae]